MCFCKGFDIQVKGPALLSRNHTGPQTKDGFYSITPKPGNARSADIFNLDPKLTYMFRVIPRARMTGGLPSAVHRIGPGMARCWSLCFLSYCIPHPSARLQQSNHSPGHRRRWLEWICHRWPCSWNPLQLPLRRPAGRLHLLLCLLGQEHKYVAALQKRPSQTRGTRYLCNMFISCFVGRATRYPASRAVEKVGNESRYRS